MQLPPHIKEHMEVCPDWSPSDPRSIFLSLAIAGEAGELANLFKKEWRDQTFNRPRVFEELGDVVAYCIMLAYHLGLDPIQLAFNRLEAFEKRPEYPLLLSALRAKRNTP
jgi:NTP pyrophosphatase (non-canonical NTP hydrolase)